MADISLAYTWAIATCNNPNVGYSQAYRNQRTIDGITYYDCSSFIWYALLAGGFDCVQANNGSDWPFTTYSWSMPDVLPRLGFVKYTDTSIPWLPGDILLNAGHTEMVYMDRVTMGAMSSTPALADQVRINNYNTNPSEFTSLWRIAPATRNWIVQESLTQAGQELTQAQQQNNADCVWSYFLYNGSASIYSVCAMLGVMQLISTINPGYKDLADHTSDQAVGICQWSGADKQALIAYSQSLSYLTYIDGEAQCDYLLHGLLTSQFSVDSPFAQNIISSQYQFTDGNDFLTTLTENFTVEERVAWFISAYLYHGGASMTLAEWTALYSPASSYANAWYRYLTHYVPGPGPGPEPPPYVGSSSSMPLWMMLKPEWKK